MVLLQTSPCDQYECQNGAQCIVVRQEPTCRCPPGFAGPRCEKLITVNFVGKDSYVELASAKVRPQANISLQVRLPPTQPLEGPQRAPKLWLFCKQLGGGAGPTPCRGFYRQLLTPLGNSRSTTTCQAGTGDSVGDKTAKPVAQDRRARKWSMTTLGDMGACRWGCNPSLLGRIREGSPEAVITKLRPEG